MPASQPVLMEYTPTDTGLSKTMRLLVPKPAQGAPPLPTNAGVELNVNPAALMHLSHKTTSTTRANATGCLGPHGVQASSEGVQTTVAISRRTLSV